MSQECEVCGIAASDLVGYLDEFTLEEVYFERTGGVTHCLTCDPSFIIEQQEQEEDPWL